MKRVTSVKRGTSRRSFLRSGIVSAGAATLSATVMGKELSAFERADAREGPAITGGDIAILRFLAAPSLEITILHGGPSRGATANYHGRLERCRESHNGLKSMISGPFFLGTLAGVGCRMTVVGRRSGTLLGTPCGPLFRYEY
jgi:hypothetical protein